MPNVASRLARDFYYSNGRPTRAGRIANRLMQWWSATRLPPRMMQTLEMRGRFTGKRHRNPVVIATVNGERFLVSMLGPNSEWVKNVQAREGRAVLRHGGRERIRLVDVPVEERAPILREYVRIAPGGRRHFPLEVGAPLTEFAAIADRYPVFRIQPR